MRKIYLIGLLMMALQANAQEWVEWAKLLPDPYSNDGVEFGSSIAIEGNTAVVGAPYFNNGEVFLFAYENGKWVYQASLKHSLPYDEIQFGGDVVDIKGDVVVIGTSGADNYGVNSAGMVFLYQKPAEGWKDMEETAILMPSDTLNYGEFGSSLSLGTDEVVVGMQGAVYVYEKTGSSWEQQNAAIQRELEQENLKARSAALKNQLHPHFLYNSLSLLCDLIYHEQEAAEEFVVHLSRISRYLLENAEVPLTTLSQELDFLKSYLHTIELRFRDCIQVEINIPESYLHCSIPPMTLQILMENAIKHNVFSPSQRLSVSFETVEDRLVITNNLAPKTQCIPFTGIGLDNILKRYEMAGKALEISSSAQFFKVTLALN